jgi:outer membrane immunogenic protein
LISSPEATNRSGKLSEGNAVKKVGIYAAALAASLAGSSAMAADLGLPAVAPVPIFSWTGIYIGAEGGWGGLSVGDVRNVANTNYPVGYKFSLTENGMLIGGDVGANYQFNWFVAGIEADAQWSGWSNIDTLVSPLIAGNYTIGNHSNTSIDTVTGRLGFAYDNRWLIYGKGGAAWRDINGTLNNTFNAAGVLQDTQQGAKSVDSGYVVGAGVEWAATDAISLKVEYDWYNFGNQPSSATTCLYTAGGAANCVLGHVDAAGATTTTATAWEIKAGINIRFGWPPAAPAPVVARY